jgi:hypothetical protein
MRDQGLADPAAREQSRTSRSDARIEVPAGAASTGATDEDADLLEHLANPGDRVRRVARAVVGVDGTTWKHKGTGGKAAPARTAKHADLDPTSDVTEQRDRAGGDRSRRWDIGHARMVWARWSSTTLLRDAKL